MEYESLSGGSVKVTLSRRNLLTLLAKLDEPTSMRTLYRKFHDSSSFLVVQAEEDEEHYKDRTPGPVSEITEAVIEKLKRIQ